MRRVSVFPVFVALFGVACSEKLVSPVLPSPPENVTATVTPSRKIEITWSKRPDVESVVAYSVYRDGLLIGESPGLGLLDSLGSQGQSHDYSVASRSQSGIVSERSPAVSVFAPDAIPPRALSSNPADASINVAPSSTIQVTFNEAMDSTSFAPAAFTVKDAVTGAAYPGTIAYNKTTRVATFTPSAPFPSERRIAVTVSGVKDASGLALAQPLSFGFTIRETVPPTVVSFSPANGSVVPVGTFPTIKFSERMGDLSGIRWIDNKGTLVATGGTQDTLTNTVTMLPTKRVSSFVPYTVVIDDRTKDRAGNSVAGNPTFTFQYDEWSLPGVVSVFPAENATNVSTAVVLTVTLDAPTQQYNDYEIRFNIRETGASTTLPAFYIIPGQGNRITLTPPTLKPGTSYTAVFYQIFTDSKNVRHESETVWSFTTANQ